MLMMKEGVFLMLKFIQSPYYLLSSSAQEDVASFLSNAATPEEIPYDSVIVGLAKDILDYQHINTAFQVLTKEHPSQKKVAGDKSKTSIPLLATHRGRYMRDDEGLLSLGPGPFVAALENAAGVQAQVVGKPTKAFFETVIGSLRFKSGEGAIAIVGDDIETDLGGGARELGLWRVLGKPS
jgi:ribonucleotide monophosphatase NagD (HAD superfamily)